MQVFHRKAPRHAPISRSAVGEEAERQNNVVCGRDACGGTGTDVGTRASLRGFVYEGQDGRRARYVLAHKVGHFDFYTLHIAYVRAYVLLRLSIVNITILKPVRMSSMTPGLAVALIRVGHTAH